MYKTLQCLITTLIFSLTAFTIVHAQSWSELGGTNSLHASATINCIYSDATGNIYAGGSFTNASFKPYIAKYNDTSWSELGGSNSQQINVGSTIRVITGDAAGNIYAGGSFTNASHFEYVAKWDHATNTWGELGGINSLQANSAISCMTTDLAGNIYVAGSFTNGSAVYNGTRYVARWDHLTNTWSELGGINSLSANGEISTITSDAAGNIYAGGYFTNATGYNYVAKWDHATNTWSQLDGANSLFAIGTIYTLISDAAGNIYAAGAFINLNGNQYVAKWDHTNNTWSEVGGTNSLQGNSLIFSLAMDPAGNIYAGGYLAIGSLRYVAKWDHITNTWGELSGTNHLLVVGSIACVTTDAMGNIYAAGYFTNGNDNRYVAKFTPLPIAIYLSQNNVCAGTSVAYWAETTNISSPSFFQWKVNGNNVGTDSIGYTYIPINGDTVTCVVTSSSASDTSNLIIMQVMPIVTPSIAIIVTPSSAVDNGTAVIFTATATNGGNNLQYQWLKNGQPIQGATNVTWSAVTGVDCLPGDVITASLHSSETCAFPATAVSNAITMTTKTTGINNVKNGIALSLYPNPNEGTFVLDGTVKELGEYQVIITNILGQKMYGQSINAKGQNLHLAISVSGLAQGMYYLKMIKDKETMWVKKFERMN